MTRFIAWLGRGTDWAMERLGIVPTTQLRVVVTIGLMIATGAVYLGLAVKVLMFGLRNPVVNGSSQTWIPDGTWLTFLAGMAGLDTLHFLGKRATHKPEGDKPPQPKPDV